MNTDDDRAGRFMWEEVDASIRRPVEFSYTRQELEALFCLANEEDVEKGRRYDARNAAINIWSHRWQDRATWEESDTVGTSISIGSRRRCSMKSRPMKIMT
jgi:hypothetical protein